MGSRTASLVRGTRRIHCRVEVPVRRVSHRATRPGGGGVSGSGASGPAVRRSAHRAALAREELTRGVLEEVARRHNVCPFALSLDCSPWVDVIVGDYNYVFDPAVSLKRFFADEPGAYAFLVDEAHNLVDRAREMFSGELDIVEIAEVEAAIAGALPHCAMPLRKIQTQFRRETAVADLDDKRTVSP